ncbi:MAG: nitronate monooxygenase [Syntrophales bacterium]|jgi:NAD(P)H-dependent flavin oxidoreductase YrpB (nitropropane dioxygenase family)|nr:nitronate monooxygenase [Syntrophales bacterium]MDY0044313.1 nitronate monooxygenase [Syntrophales bacterium]
MKWTTKITELLGCKYPILQGATEMIGTWSFAAAVAESGAHGTITASICKTPDKLKDDIKKCKKATSGSFGVNLSIGLCPQVEDMLEVCIEEGVPVETSVYKPDALAERIKEAGLPWIHKSARVKDAVHAQETGAHAIILVGTEGAGIKNPAQLPTMTTILWGLRALSVPVIAAGGIGDSHSFLGALAMGAEGVTMGSALMTTKECPIGNAFKEKILKLSLDEPDFRTRVLTPAPFDKNAVRPEPEDIDWSHAASFAVTGINTILSVKEFVQQIIQGAEEILETRQFLKN